MVWASPVQITPPAVSCGLGIPCRGHRLRDSRLADAARCPCPMRQNSIHPNADDIRPVVPTRFGHPPRPGRGALSRRRSASFTEREVGVEHLSMRRTRKVPQLRFENELTGRQIVRSAGIGRRRVRESMRRFPDARLARPVLVRVGISESDHFTSRLTHTRQKQQTRNLRRSKKKPAQWPAFSVLRLERETPADLVTSRSAFADR